MNIQSMLTLGAMLLVSLVSLRFNASVLQSSSVEIENKVYLTAFSLADDMIEEIKNRSFDETTLRFPTNTPSSLTKSDSLGPEASETAVSFDDIDDYNGYVKSVSAPHAENYSVTCKVFYVGENDWDEKTSDRTFYKKVEVKVTSPYIRSSVKLSFIFTLK